jgi:hypothetical protein
MPSNSASFGITGVDQTTSVTKNLHAYTPLHQYEVLSKFSSQYNDSDELLRATSGKKGDIPKPNYNGTIFKKQRET